MNKGVIKKHFLGLIIFLAFLTLGIATLSDYGLNIDEPIHFMRGQAYFRLLTTGEKNYKNLNVKRRSAYQYDTYNGHYFLNKDGGHPPLNDILAATTNYIFYQKLGILGDLQSHHLFEVFVSSLLVLLVYSIAARHYGVFAGIIAALSISLYPIFWGESHFNIKDPVEASFFAFAIYFFFLGIEKAKAKYIYISSFFSALALGTKFNIVFAPLIIIPWVIVRYFSKIKKFRQKIFSRIFNIPKNLLLSLLLYPLIVLTIFFVSWPYLWKEPLRRLLEVLGYYKGIGTHKPQGVLNINTYPALFVSISTPLVILFFSIMGIFVALRRVKKEKNKISLFILLWFLVPILRVSLPGATIYKGVRQIMEYIPAMAILAGLGANNMATWLHGYMAERIKPFNNLTMKPFYILIILSFLPITYKLYTLHPNENVYINPLIGGLKGAYERKIDGAGETMGNVYVQGVEWINKNAEKNAKVTIPFGILSNVPFVYFRDDIDFGRHRSGLEQRGEYLMKRFSLRTRNQYILDYLERYFLPLYSVEVDGVALLKIWKNDQKHLRPGFNNKIQVKPQVRKVEKNNELIFDFGRKVIIESVGLDFGPEFSKEKLLDNPRTYYKNNNQWQEEKYGYWNSEFVADYSTEFTERYDAIFHLAARKTRFIKIKLNEPSLELVDWEAEILADFTNLSLNLKDNHILTASGTISKDGEYTLVGSGGEFTPQVSINNKHYDIEYDKRFIREPLFNKAESYDQLTGLIFLNKGNVSLETAINPAKNLLLNSSFEQGLENWSGGEIVMNGKDGDNALLLKRDEKGQSYIYQKAIPEFEEDVVYFVSFDYNLKKGKAAVGIWQPPHAKYPKDPEWLFLTNGEWQTGSFVLKPAPGTEQLDIYLYVIADDNNGAEILFDNISVQKFQKDSFPKEFWLVKH